MSVPALGHALWLVSLVAELQAPDPVDQDRRYRQLGFRVLTLHRLQQRNAIEHERPRQVDRVDPATFAGAVVAGRARAERVNHSSLRYLPPALKRGEDDGD